MSETPSKPYCPSHLRLIRRVQKSAFNPYGVTNVTRIAINQPAMILFGGDCTDFPRVANNYASMMESILKNANIHDVQIYSAYYMFGDRNTFLDRVNIFRRAGDRVTLKAANECKLANMNANEPIPNIVQRAFNLIFKPRLVNATGHRRDINSVVTNMRRICLWAHSHGAAIIRQVSDYMADQMRDMGFSNTEITQIQQNVLVIQHAPITPLHHVRFNTLSFASISDYMMDLNNNMSDWFFTKTKNYPPMYMSVASGNLIIASNLIIDGGDEHDTCQLRIDPNWDKQLTPNGHVVFDAERNAIVAAAHNTITAGEIPSVAELVSGPTVDFEKMRQSGQAVYDHMVNDLRHRKQSPKRAHQK